MQYILQSSCFMSTDVFARLTGFLHRRILLNIAKLPGSCAIDHTHLLRSRQTFDITAQPVNGISVLLPQIISICCK